MAAEHQVTTVHPPPEMAESYYRFLAATTCPLDLAEQRDLATRPRQRRRNETLLRNMRGEGKSDSLTMEMVVRHHQGGPILHTRPKHGAPEFWFQIDLDAHHGQEGLQQAADLLKQVLPGIYQEPSTRGRGLHLYVWVRGVRKPEVFNKSMARWEALSKRLVAHAGLDIGVEFLHTFTLVTADLQAILRRGKTAKAPRPADAAAFKTLLEGKRYTIREISKALSRHLVARGLSTRVPHGTHSIPLPSHYRSISRGVEKHGVVKSQVSVAERIKHFRAGTRSDNAFERMTQAAMLFNQLYGRPASVEELLGFYQELFDADPGGTERRARAVSVVKFAESVFDPQKVGRGGFDLAAQLQIVNGVLGRFRHHPTVRYKNELTDEDLAIGLYCVERNSFHVWDKPARQYSMAQGSLQGMFRALQAAGLTMRGCNANKEVAIKKILRLAGLLHYVDRGYRVGSFGQKIVIGPNHPRHDEWRLFQEKFPALTAKQVAGAENEWLKSLAPTPATPPSEVSVQQTQLIRPKKKKKTKDPLAQIKRMKRNGRERRRRAVAREILKEWGYRPWGGFWPPPRLVRNKALRQAGQEMRAGTVREQTSDDYDHPPVNGGPKPLPARRKTVPTPEETFHELA
ncbi:MAG TPA: hypothetical protein VM008_09750 [Phycisphaerae bacterium]|nr:hypothetical protein [Phycisphaerae bacterium]